MSDLSVMETRKQFEEQDMTICGLRNRLADAEVKLVEGEKLRKKLHYTILVHIRPLNFRCDLTIGSLKHINLCRNSRAISVFSAEYDLYYLMKALQQIVKSLLFLHLRKPWDGELICCKMVH